MREKTPRATSPHSAFRLAAMVNGCLLVAFMVLFNRMDQFQHDPGLAEPSAWNLLFYVGQAMWWWFLSLIGVSVLLRLRIPGVLVRLLFGLGFLGLWAWLYADLLIVYLYQRHLSWHLLGILSEPGIREDLAISTKQMVQILGALALGLALQLGLHAAQRFILHRFPRAWLPSFRSQLTCAAVGSLLVVLTWSAYAHTRPKEARQDTEMIPSFVARDFHITASGIWSFFGLEHRPYESDPEAAREDYLDAVERQQYDAFRHQYQLPARIEVEKEWDVLFLAAESWRWDMLDPDVMPQLTAFTRERGWASPAHFAGGNTTPEGLFGLFSGLSPLYWFACHEASWNPLLFPILERLGYRNSIYTSSALTYKEMDRYLFADAIHSLVSIDELKIAESTRTWKKRRLEVEDRRMVDEYLKDLDTRGSGKRCDFLFFYVTHYNYYYPDEFEIDKPAMSADFSVNDFTLKTKRQRIFNRYRNSVRYLDYLLGQIITKLKATGRLDRTLIVITGDHGEEFFERGRFGHQMAINRFQNQVPLVLHVPGGFSSRYQLTSHEDVVPTILSELGVRLPLNSLFTGKPLRDYEAERDRCLTGAMFGEPHPLQFALIDKAFQLHFVNQSEDVQIIKHYTFDDGRLSKALEKSRLAEYRRFLNRHKRHFGPH